MKVAGRTKRRLAALLTGALRDAGYPVREIDPGSLMEATGHYRTSRSYQNEALRWEAFIPRSDTPRVKFWLTSYATMSELLRSGVSFSAEGATQIWVDVGHPTLSGEAG